MSLNAVLFNAATEASTSQAIFTSLKEKKSSALGNLVSCTSLSEKIV